MSRKALEWAQRLRGELVERIDELRVVLADIEPLQEELIRLEAQLEGVERLIAVYVNQLGIGGVPAQMVSNGIASHEIALQQAPDAGPAVVHEDAQLAAAARAFAGALRYETVRLLSRCGERLQAAWIAGRLRVVTTLNRLSGEQ